MIFSRSFIRAYLPALFRAVQYPFNDQEPVVNFICPDRIIFYLEQLIEPFLLFLQLPDTTRTIDLFNCKIIY